MTPAVLPTTAELVERLATHKTLGAAPRAELEWLAAHGEFRRYEAGEKAALKGAPAEEMIVDSANAFGDYAVKAANLENVGCVHISDFSQRYGFRQHSVVGSPDHGNSLPGNPLKDQTSGSA